MSELKAPKMLTIRQCARLTGLSYDFIQQMCRDGKLVCIRVGNRTLVNADKLVEWLNTGDRGACNDETK